jgi:hypothetical protein
MEQYLTVQLMDKAEAKAANRAQINQLLAVLNALLALAVIIAAIGISTRWCCRCTSAPGRSGYCARSAWPAAARR